MDTDCHLWFLDPLDDEEFLLELDWSKTRPNPHARRLREAKEIRIVQRSADGSEQEITLDSLNRLFELASASDSTPGGRRSRMPLDDSHTPRLPRGASLTEKGRLTDDDESGS